MARSKIFDSAQAIATRRRMVDKQRQELTPTMIEFHDRNHELNIVEDSHGFVTCSIRCRALEQPGPHALIRFQKKNGLGVLWTFLNPARLRYLAFEPDNSALCNLAEVQGEDGRFHSPF